MTSDTFSTEDSTHQDELPASSVPDLTLYLTDTSVEELCHLLARVVVRLSAEHEQAALQEEAA